MMLRRILILTVCAGILPACSKLPKIDQVLPDKRTAYQKSKDLPALEVPPDLTITEGENKATIPGEAESTTLSEFEKRRDQIAKRGNIVLGSGEAEDELWLALQGSPVEVWPELRRFWSEKGYDMELDDPELGVLETDWKQTESGRDKYRIFTEPDEQGGVILFLSSEREQLSEGTWLESAKDDPADKKTLRELNLHFYGQAMVNSDSADSSAREPAAPANKPPAPKAEIVDIGDDKTYLAIPREFTRAWRMSETVILRAGYTILDKDQETGTYNFLYIKPVEERDKKGFFSRLKFWGDDEDEGIPYQLSLTGVGNKTEAILMTEDGEWDSGADAKNILNTFRELYDQL